jgi:hypothetical protein
MGGGPTNTDVVHSTCILTFPKCSGAEPIPVDARYLHSIGINLIKRLARDRVGNDMKIGLLIQKSNANQRRYLGVSSNEILRENLQETFSSPEVILLLHVISLEKISDLNNICIHPEEDPHFSPEPLAPLGIVFPTLPVEGLNAAESYHEPSQNVKESILCDSSMKKSSKPWEYRKPHDMMLIPTPQVDKFLDKCVNSVSPSSIDQVPFARLVQAEESTENFQSNNDYTELDIAESDHQPSTEPTFFISSSWHIQAEEMSASMRLGTQHIPQTASQCTERDEEEKEESEVVAETTTLEESFILLDRNNIN